MKRLFLFLLIFLNFIISCKNENEEICHIKDIKKFITIPDKYQIIECDEIIDIGIRASHLKIDKSIVADFLFSNKGFLSYLKYNKNYDANIFSNHEIFYSRLNNDFNKISNFSVAETFFYQVKDDKNNYISCLITLEGHLYILLEP